MYKRQEYERVVQIAVLNIGYAFQKIYDNDSINSIPEIRKNKKVQITDLDARLLNMEYQDFVLSIMRQMYFEHKNPSAVKYSDGINTVSLSELQGTPYKVEKPSEKIKPFIRAGIEIERARRSYGIFKDEQLRNRLEFFVNKGIANSDEIFEKIVEFASCDLSTKDKDNCIKFLRILDAVADGKISEKEALAIIESNDLKPVSYTHLDVYKRQYIDKTYNSKKSASESADVFKADFAQKEAAAKALNQIKLEKAEQAAVEREQAYIDRTYGTIHKSASESADVFNAKFADEIAPVSYTHLDVYKRQGTNIVQKFSIVRNNDNRILEID